MIPLHKLNELPRTLRLRKSASLFGEAERRLVLFGQLPKEETEYLGRVAELLAKDEKFSGTAVTALKAAQISFAADEDASATLTASTAIAASADVTAGKKNSAEIRRALNTVHYILLAETGRYQADWDFIEAKGVLDSSKHHSFIGMQVYLEDIRSPFNVGSMFRAAESFGVEKIWLSPLCADPRHKRAERSAMGCVDILPWERLAYNHFVAISGNESKAPHPFLSGPFFALETRGTPLADFSFPSEGIIIVGSEELGVSPEALAAADASMGRVSIPTWGAKGSLNVAVAFGIAMHVWALQLAKG